MKRQASFRATIESLEDRYTPAGIATALLTGGNLTLLGDELANGLTITQATDGRLVLTPDATTQIRLGEGGTPQATPLTLPIPVTDHVFAELRQGDDILTISGVILPRSLSIEGGNGNNVANLTGITVGEDVVVRNRNGADTTNLRGRVTVQGELNIFHGDGGGLIDDNATTVLRVVKNFHVRTGLGADVIDLDDAQSIHVGGKVIVNSAFGALDAATSECRFDTRAGGLSLGGVEVINGSGFDRVRFDSDGPVTILDAAVVRNGDGGSLTEFVSTADLSLGNTSIINGIGADTNRITSNAITKVNGTVRFDNGPDNTATTNELVGRTSAQVDRDIWYVNGGGLDTNVIGGPLTRTLRVLGRVLVDNADGGSTTTVGMGATSLFIGDMTRIAAGRGADSVVVGSAAATNMSINSLVIDSGDDTNQATVIGGQLSMNGRLTVRGGPGTDQVTVTTQTRDGTIAGPVDIDLGTGNNQRATLQSATAGVLLNLGQTLSVVTNDLTSGGSDAITLLRVGVHARTVIATGLGDDVLAIDDSDLNDLVIRTDGGNDAVALDRAAQAATTRFSGDVSILTGAGNDLIQVGTVGQANRRVVFAKACSFDGGNGNDTLTMLIGGNALALGGLPVATEFEVLN